MLDKFVSIYVPSTLHDSPAPAELVAAALNNTMTTLALAAGGVTVTQGQGAWYSEALGKLITESVYIVKAFCDEGNFSQVHAAARLCADTLKVALEQEAISLETSQGLDFI